MRSISNVKMSVYCDDDSTPVLGVNWHDSEKVSLAALYRVTLDSVDTMVLAESEQGAISQASCQELWKGTDEDTTENKEKRAIAVRIPMMVRGWGSQKF